MTQIERLTKEFQELDRVTPRPLDHEDYAITAIQFANELFKEIHPSIIKQLGRAGEDYSKLIQCFEDLDAIKKKQRNLMGLFMDVIDQRIETPDNGDCWWCGGSGVDPNGLNAEYECRVCKTWHKEIL